VDESLSGDAGELWLLIERGDVPIGFTGLAGDDISTLVFDPASAAT
jgi:hypothetical protein